MLGEFSNADARASRVAKGSVNRRRRVVAGLQRRLRAPDEVPAAGLIVFRSGSQILR
jgi:hypothetical protein